MYIIEDRKEVEDFIHKVFNYYNGRINRIIPSFINIEWILDDLNTLGFTNVAGTVTIYPMVFQYYSDSKIYFNLNIIMAIIHELHHVDQYIEYNQMHYRKDFVESIEFPVEFMTWCANHKCEISELTGGYCHNNDELNCNINKYSGYQYNYYRIRSIHDYIFTILDDIWRESAGYDPDYFKPIMYECMDNRSDIWLEINDNYVMIKENGVFNDIKEIQNFVYSNYNMYKYRENVKGGGIYECDDNSIIIKVNIKTYNYMAEIYNGGNKNEQ